MRPPETIYRGERLKDRRGRITGVRVTVGGKVLDPARSQKVWCHSPDGFEWGYGGSGPAQLALALVFDATGDPDLTSRTYQWVKWATVSQWLTDSWEITAGEIQRWVQQAINEEGGTPAPICVDARACRACGCTDVNCGKCFDILGRGCTWVEGEDPPLCSRCAAEQEVAALVSEVEGGAS